MESTARDRTRIRSEINVTPLVDVCLVLLIIFMVVTPMLNEAVSVQLPYGSNLEPRPQNAQQLRVSIAYGVGSAVFLGADRTPVLLSDLRGRLEKLRRQAPWSDVVVRADRRLTYGEVRAVLRSLNEAGIRQLSLAAERSTGRDDRPELPAP
jgi:biopolymer transport protein TolR